MLSNEILLFFILGVLIFFSLISSAMYYFFNEKANDIKDHTNKVRASWSCFSTCAERRIEDKIEIQERIKINNIKYMTHIEDINYKINELKKDRDVPK